MIDSATQRAAAIRPVIALIEGMDAGDLPQLLTSAPQVFSHLFASLAVAGRAAGSTGKNTARWSILLAAAESQLRLDVDGKLELPLDGLSAGVADSTDFLATWAHWQGAQAPLAADVQADWPCDLPFVGGWSFYLSFEFAQQLEPSLRLPEFEPARRVGFPVAIAQYHAAALVFDHQTAKLYLVHDDQHPATLAALHAALGAYRADKPPLQSDNQLVIEGLVADESARFQAGVQQVLAYLRAGDVFQANLSRAWRFYAPQPDASARIFRRLAKYNPAPFAAWYRLQEGQIMSSSPERLVDHQPAGDGAGWVSTRPIAGTRRRDTEAAQDAMLRAELQAHPKERAEHVMMIDLERNDLGRVCAPGSVQVDEFMVLESFAHVHHLVSNVRGQLQAGRSVFDLLAAVFPGGTITGCPKVRCMEILAELEQTGRGPYTGSVGYLSLDGTMDSNILIRTVFLAADGIGEFRTGAGIVMDSDPLRETIETEEKARGLLLALTEPAA
jgi:anthranilate synthase component 1